MPCSFSYAIGWQTSGLASRIGSSSILLVLSLSLRWLKLPTTVILIPLEECAPLTGATLFFPPSLTPQPRTAVAFRTGADKGICPATFSLPLMAEALRCVTIKGTMTTANPENNIASWKNETGSVISIRKINLQGSNNGMDAGDSQVVEISMDPTIASNVDQDETRRVIAQVRAPADAHTTDGGHVCTNLLSFAKGQWELQPGEDLHLNKSGAFAGQMDAQVWWHIN